MGELRIAEVKYCDFLKVFCNDFLQQNDKMQGLVCVDFVDPLGSGFGSWDSAPCASSLHLRRCILLIQLETCVAALV
jgi:hypothetical protein